MLHFCEHNSADVNIIAEAPNRKSHSTHTAKGDAGTSSRATVTLEPNNNNNNNNNNNVITASMSHRRAKGGNSNVWVWIQATGAARSNSSSKTSTRGCRPSTKGVGIACCGSAPSMRPCRWAFPHPSTARFEMPIVRQHHPRLG